MWSWADYKPKVCKGEWNAPPPQTPTLTPTRQSDNHRLMWVRSGTPRRPKREQMKLSTGFGSHEDPIMAKPVPQVEVLKAHRVRVQLALCAALCEKRGKKERKYTSTLHNLQWSIIKSSKCPSEGNVCVSSMFLSRRTHAVSILFQGKVKVFLPVEESNLRIIMRMCFPLLIAGNKQFESEFNSTNKNHMLVFPLPSSRSTTLFPWETCKY